MKFTATHVTVLACATMATLAFLMYSGVIPKEDSNLLAHAIVAVVAWFAGLLKQQPSWMSDPKPEDKTDA